MDNRVFYTWDEFLSDVYGKIIPALRPRAHEFDGVWGPPRGGLILAVILSHALTLPFWEQQDSVTERTLIVDDIADTGKTLSPFKNKNVVVTIFYHRQSVVCPDFWLREKREAWIVFPWEAALQHPV